MNSLLVAASVVVPLVIYMAAGILVRKTSILSEENAKAIDKLCFKLFIPISLFTNVYSCNISEVFEPDFFGFVVLYIILFFFAIYFPLKYFVKDKRDHSTIVQGIYRSNYVLFGVAVAQSFSNSEALALVSALNALIVPLYNILAVVLFEYSKGKKVRIGRLLISILKNPLVEAGIIGVIFSLLELKLPSIVETALSSLGAVATPLALVALGSTLSFKSVVAHRKYLVTAVVGKLFGEPIIAVLIGIAAGFNAAEMITVIAILATPTAVASAPMAQSLGGNGKLAGEIVAFSTAFSFITLFVFVSVLGSFGFLG